MELLVATWSVRLASLAAVAVGVVSVSAGTPALDTAVRAIAAAFAFTVGGRILLGRLEPPERRIQRLLARHTEGARESQTGREPRKGGES